MNSNIAEEGARFFKERPGFRRAFAEMRKKWMSYGRVTNGKIVLECAEEEERQALQSFMAPKRFSGKTVEFRFCDFEKALHDTKYKQVNMKELLEAYFGEPILSKTEQKLMKESAREQFWIDITSWAEQVMPTNVQRWISQMRELQDNSFGYVCFLWNRDVAEAEQTLKCVCKAMAFLQSNEVDAVQLAVLAAKVSGNPHYFDRGRSASQLLAHAICAKKHVAFPQMAEEVQSLYESVGIVVDKISSTVTAYGLHIVKHGNVYMPMEMLTELGEPMTISLANLDEIEQVYTDSHTVFVVENEMVFCHVMPICIEYHIPIICTSGQLSKAAQRIIRILSCQENRIYYSGDLDPEGLQIADDLSRKYPEQLELWRMSVCDYEESKSDENISKQRLSKMERIGNPDLQNVADAMKACKKSGYQENIIKLLEDDLKKYGMEECLK